MTNFEKILCFIILISYLILALLDYKFAAAVATFTLIFLGVRVRGSILSITFLLNDAKQNYWTIAFVGLFVIFSVTQIGLEVASGVLFPMAATMPLVIMVYSFFTLFGFIIEKIKF